ncbi:MAG: NAD-binding protein [Anaerolineaceae bacterium]|jgi:trk system potassium uptake protein TrkA
MFVVIAGGGRTGAQLARYLIDEGHQVHVLENRKEVLARLHKELPTEVIFAGNPLNPAMLEEVGMANAQVFAATTATDEVNLALCYFTREKYKVARTIARINDPRNAWLYDQKLHVDVSVNQAELLSHLIEEEMSLGDMMTLLKLRKGRYSLVEEKIPAGAKALGAAIKDLQFPENCVIAAIIRGGKIVVPRGATVFEEDDEVLAVTDDDGAKQLSELFAKVSKK